jgi:hypothetical protein
LPQALHKLLLEKQGNHKQMEEMKFTAGAVLAMRAAMQIFNRLIRQQQAITVNSNAADL